MTARTRVPRVLAYLAEHPGATAAEVGRGLGLPRQLQRTLREMELRGEVVAEWRADPGHGRPVRRWHAAPPGTVPPPPPPADLAAAERRRERDRRSLRARRVLAASLSSAHSGCPPVPRLPGAACRAADPELFFAPEAERVTDCQRREAAAKAVCAGCPARARCLDWALETRQAYGIWGGLTEAERRAMLRQADRRAS